MIFFKYSFNKKSLKEKFKHKIAHNQNQNLIWK